MYIYTYIYIIGMAVKADIFQKGNTDMSEALGY